MSRLLVAVLPLAFFASAALAQQQQITAPSPDGKRTVSAKNQIITVTDNKTNKAIISIRSHRADITGLAFSPDGKLIGSVDKDGVLNLFDTATGRLLRKIKAGVGGGLSFSKDGKTLEVKSPNATKKFDVATGKETS